MALVLPGRPVITEMTDQLLNAGSIGEIVIVLGAEHRRVEPEILKHTKIKVVYNKDYKMGQTSSFQAGLRAASPDAEGIMLLPVDVPAVESVTFEDLAVRFLAHRPLIQIPVYQNRRGHPPVFHSRLRENLLAWDTGTGINVFIERHAGDIAQINVDDPAVTVTFNTPQEFETIQLFMSRRPGTQSP